MRYFLELSYNGSGFNGWQRQNNVPSIQQTLEEAIGKILHTTIGITGAGRTDTGVNAAYYVAHFDFDGEMDDKFCYKLNAVLPEQIAIFGIKRVDDTLHARFDAKYREYKYYIIGRKDPFTRHTSWQYYIDLDMDKMNLAAECLLKNDDFTTFSKLHSGNKTTLCRVSKAIWVRDGERLIFTIGANRFLRNMVRSIVATLVDVGRGKITPEEFEQILLSKDRSRASCSAPAQGLFLTDVKY